MPIRLRFISDFVFLAIFSILLIAYPLHRFDHKVIDLEDLRMPWSRGTSVDLNRMQIRTFGGNSEVGLQISEDPAPIRELVIEISPLQATEDGFTLFYIPYRLNNHKFHPHWKILPDIQNLNGKIILKWSFFEPVSGERIRIAIPDESVFTINSVHAIYLRNIPLWMKVLAFAVFFYGCIRGFLFAMGCFINNPYAYKVSLLGVWLCGVIFFKIWSTQGIPLVALGNNDFDDTLFLELSRHLMNGEWLGPYNARTLIKGLGYPIWIAGSFISGIPLLLSQELFYISATLLLAVILSSLMNRPLIFLSIAGPFLILSPGTFNNEIVRVIRDGIYPALTIWVVLFFTGLVLWKRKPICQMVLWAIGLGFFLAAFFLTREEGIWLTPMIFIFTVYSIFSLFRSDNLSKKTRIGICFLPLLVCSLLIISVSALNYINYGLFGTTELKTPAFSNAYAALTRVVSSNFIQYVPVTRQTREEIYEISPAFAELKNDLEGDLGKKWAKASRSILNASENREISGGHFVFALREAVARQGYHTDFRSASSFYNRLAEEVDDACKADLIDCSPKTNLPPLAPVWRKEHIKNILKSLPRDSYNFLTMQSIAVSDQYSQGSQESLQIYEDQTWDRLAPLVDELNHQKGKAKIDHFRIKLLGWLAEAYTLILHLVAPLAIFGYFFSAFNHFRNRSLSFLVVFNSAIFFSILSRFFILVYLDKAAFTALNAQYLASGYALLLVFCVAAIAEFFIGFRITSQ